MQCSVFIATSVDGFIARGDGGLDWLSGFQEEGQDYGYARFAASVDAVVLGRATYDVVLGFGAWPYAGKRVAVMTHRPLEGRHGEEVFAGGAGELAAKLAAEGARRVYVDGGQVIRQFLAAGLIDDVTLSVIPVILGDGIRLFEGGGAPEQWLALEGVEPYPSGLVQLRYRRAAAAAARGR
jgi:dihydrofolate reductase